MPKVEHKDGYYQVSPTGVENLSSFLGALVPQLIEGQDRRKKNEIAIQNLAEDFHKRVAAFESQDIERQDEMKATNPKLVEAIYDDSAILKLQGKKLPKDYKAPVPPTRKRTTAEQAALDESVGKAKKVQAEAGDIEDKAALDKIMRDKRREYLTNPKDKIDEFIGWKGEPPSSTDQFMAFAETEENQLKDFRGKIAGTIEFRELQAKKEMEKLMTEYQPKTKADTDALQGVADYIAGKSTSFPANIPKSLQDKQNVFEDRRIKVSEANLGISREQLAQSRYQIHVKTMQELMAGGMSAKEANAAADYGLKNGKLPPEANLSMAAKTKAEQTLQEQQIELNKIKIQEGQINNPQIAILLATVRAKLQKGAIEDVAPNIQPELKKIYELAKIPTGDLPKPTDPWYKNVMNFFKGGATALGSTQSKFGGGSVTTPVVGGKATTTPPPKTEAKAGIMSGPVKELGPELNTAVEQLMNQWDYFIKDPNTRTAMVEKIKASKDELIRAVQAGDEATIRRILLGGE